MKIAPVGFCMDAMRRKPNPRRGHTLFWRAFDARSEVDFRVLREIDGNVHLVEFRVSLDRFEVDWPVKGIPGVTTVRRTVDWMPAIELRNGSMSWRIVEGTFEPDHVFGVCEFSAYPEGWEPIEYDAIPDQAKREIARCVATLLGKLQMGQKSLVRYIECATKVSIH